MLDVTAKQGISARIRLVIGDRQPIVLQGLRSVLGAQHDFDVVASSSDGTSCVEAIRNLAPDIALLADTLPDLTVTEILAIAKAENLSTRLVFFTESESDHDLTAAIAAGTCTAISKYASPDTMLRSLRLMTKRSVPPEQFDSRTGKHADGDGKIEKMLELLTHRERQIVRLVSEGMSNKEIARQLDVSPGTVKVHLYNIFQKLEITNRTVLATLALLQRPSGFGTLALAFLAIAIADELKASEANDMLPNDMLPNDDSIGHAGEHAEYEPWKKAILRHLIVWESSETPPLTQREFSAKLSQITSTAVATEALHAAEQSAGTKPWKDGSVGSSSPSLATPLLRGMNDTQIGGDPTPEHLFPRLVFNPMSLQGGYGTFATLAGALIYALQDPHLAAAQTHDAAHASIDSFQAVTGENATTKVAAINNADAHHVDNSVAGFPSHDAHLPSAFLTTGNDGVAGEGALSQRSNDAAGDNLQKTPGLVGPGHDAGLGGDGRGQLTGGNVEHVVHRSTIDSNSASVFDFASGPSRINLAAFGALAWLHMTAASKSIPPHTLAWIYNSASNETIVYVNPTDHVLDIGDRGLVEIHLQGIVSVAESDFVGQPEGAAVALTLEQLEGTLISVAATDETVLSADNVHGIVGTSESTTGTDGVWTRLADDGLRFQFGQTRAGSGTSTRFRTFTSEAADATEESDGASRAPVRVSSIEPAHSATAAAAGNPTSKSEPVKTDTGVLSPGPNEVVGPGVAAAADAGRGNSQHASEPESAKAAAAESADAGSKPGNGGGNDAEHHAPASKATPGSVKSAEPGGAEHGKSGHSTTAPEAAEIDQGVATAASAGRGNSQHSSEPGSAKAVATESAEAGVKPGNGVGNDAEHHAPKATPGSAKTAEPGGGEHGNSAHNPHSPAANTPEAAETGEPSVAKAGSVGHGNSQHASESGSAQAATEVTEKGNGVGNGVEHHAPASDASRGSAKTAQGGVEHGHSGHDSHTTAANAPEEAQIVEPSVATADGAAHSNSNHADPGSAKAAATAMAEARSTPGNGVGNDNEHHSSASDGSRGAAKTAEPSGPEHGNSGHGLHPSSADAPEAAEIVEPSIAAADGAGRGNSQHAAEPGSAKIAATELTEAGFTPGNGAGHHTAASDGAGAPAAEERTAEPAVAEHGNSGHSISANGPEAGEIVETSVAAGREAGGENPQQAAQSAATASEAAQPAKAASEIGGAHQELVFRFDSEAAPSTPVAVVEPKEIHGPLAPHVPLGQEEDLKMIVKMVPHALDEHTADHGNNGPHHGIVVAPHDLLI